jgi:hypothetical protein
MAPIVDAVSSGTSLFATLGMGTGDRFIDARPVPPTAREKKPGTAVFRALSIFALKA